VVVVVAAAVAAVAAMMMVVVAVMVVPLLLLLLQRRQQRQLWRWQSRYRGLSSTELDGTPRGRGTACGERADEDSGV
jgi:hypothetical protein